MERTLQDQFFSQIEKSQRILVALPVLLSVDLQATAEALRLFLISLGKTVTVASSGRSVSDLPFLVEPPPLEVEVSSGGPLVVKLDTTRTKLAELRYEVANDSVDIILGAKQGSFLPEEISVVAKAEGGFDLIIILGAANYEQLGDLFSKSTELFYNTPKIAIANDPAHEYFGTINVIDVTASSCAELVAQLLFAATQPLPEEAATALLAGTISATNSFQDVRTTPQTFAVAAVLIERGARQQDIITALFKSRDFSLLKLWGRLLARVKTINKTLLYSTLPLADFEKSETDASSILPAFRELLDNVSGYQMLVLLAQPAGNEVHVLIANLPHVSLDKIRQAFLGSAMSEEPPHGAYRLQRLISHDWDITAAEKQLQNLFP